MMTGRNPQWNILQNNSHYAACWIIVYCWHVFTLDRRLRKTENCTDSLTTHNVNKGDPAGEECSKQVAASERRAKRREAGGKRGAGGMSIHEAHETHTDCFWCRRSAVSEAGFQSPDRESLRQSSGNVQASPTDTFFDTREKRHKRPTSGPELCNYCMMRDARIDP